MDEIPSRGGTYMELCTPLPRPNINRHRKFKRPRAFLIAMPRDSHEQHGRVSKVNRPLSPARTVA